MTPIDRDRLTATCQAHNVPVEHIERLLGHKLDGDISDDTRRAAWELIKSEALRNTLLPALIRIRLGFPGAPVVAIRPIPACPDESNHGKV